MHKGRNALNHALVDKFLEWFGEGDMPQILQDMTPKTGVEEVAGTVLAAADIEVHLVPIVHFVFRGKGAVVLGVHVAQEIPGTSCPTGHGGGLQGKAFA